MLLNNVERSSFLRKLLLSFWFFVLESVAKMSDSSVKNLAITDKVQKPGGCVGIFFQLIDWKKKLVKKKLFSKKLLTPG